jgi:hypothetical protein
VVQGIHPAGPGAVLIYPTAFLSHEVAPFFIFFVHFELDRREEGVRCQQSFGVFLEKLCARNPETILHLDNVVRCEQNVNILAALGKTINPRITTEVKGVSKT